MDFVITIDTEEDNWGWNNTSPVSTRNIEKIPYLQNMFDAFGVKPTYFISYPVAVNKKSARILSKIQQEGRCDIGTHCHPWNTPPFEEVKNELNSMLCNLPRELQYKKIQTLHKAIQDNFTISPVLFRAGRWGFSWVMADVLRELGYTVDSSMTSYMDWSSYQGPDFSRISPDPFLFIAGRGNAGSSHSQLMEVPASVGYLQGHSRLFQRVHKFLSRKGIRELRLLGVLARLRLMNKAWLSPEFSDHKTMERLAGAMKREKQALINFTFHSPSLKEGLTPFVGTPEARERFLETIRRFLAFAREEDIRPVRLSEVTCLVEDPYQERMEEMEIACAE